MQPPLPIRSPALDAGAHEAGLITFTRVRSGSFKSAAAEEASFACVYEPPSITVEGGRSMQGVTHGDGQQRLVMTHMQAATNARRMTDGTHTTTCMRETAWTHSISARNVVLWRNSVPRAARHCT